jgi:hypothetical protein
VNVAGSLLGMSAVMQRSRIDQKLIAGVPKAMTAFLSGEMRDTVEIHPAGSWVLEKVNFHWELACGLAHCSSSLVENEQSSSADGLVLLRCGSR